MPKVMIDYDDSFRYFAEEKLEGLSEQFCEDTYDGMKEVEVDQTTWDRWQAAIKEFGQVQCEIKALYQKPLTP